MLTRGFKSNMWLCILLLRLYYVLSGVILFCSSSFFSSWRSKWVIVISDSPLLICFLFRGLSIAWSYISDWLLFIPRTCYKCLLFPELLSWLRLSRLEESIPSIMSSCTRFSTLRICDSHRLPSCLSFLLYSRFLAAWFRIDSVWEIRPIDLMASSELSNSLLNQEWERHSWAEGLSLGFFRRSFYRRSIASLLTCLKAGRSKWGSLVVIFYTSLDMLWS